MSRQFVKEFKEDAVRYYSEHRTLGITGATRSRVIECLDFHNSHADGNKRGLIAWLHRITQLMIIQFL